MGHVRRILPMAVSLCHGDRMECTARGEVRDDLVFTALAKASPAPVVLGSPRLGDGIGKSPASAFCGSIFRDVVVDRQDS